MAQFHELKIGRINPETSDAVAIEFDVPQSLKSVFQFTAGQYLNLSAKINGGEVRRAYSICASPDSGDLTVLVKKVTQGVFSTFANEQLNPGDALQVAPPEGRFVLPAETSSPQNYLFFAAGSGITPIMSMIADILKNRPATKMVLVYGNRSADQVIFKQKLEQLASNHPDRLSIEWVYSRQEADNVHFGRIDRSKVAYIVNNKYKEVGFDTYFICGPGNMIDDVAAALTDFGLAEDKVKFERFTVSEPESDSTAQVEVPAGKAQITYVLDDEETTVTVPASDSVLDSALKNDLDAPYSCQGGICSSCIARVTEGTAEMAKNQILTDSEVAEGLILTCQARATSSTVTIDYDDV